MNLRVIKLLLLCLLLTLSTGCTLVYKAKSINKDTAKVTKKMNIAVKKVTADITSFKSLKHQLQATGEMNHQPLQLLEQKIPPLVGLLESAKETTTRLNHSQNKIRSLVKGHKKIPINSPLGGKVKLQYEHIDQIVEQVNDINEQYLDERKILTDKLAEYEIRQVNLVKAHRNILKSLRKNKKQAVKKQKEFIKHKKNRLKNRGNLTPEQRANIENKTKQINIIIDTVINKVNILIQEYNVLTKKYKSKVSTWSYPENDIYNFTLFIEKTKSEHSELRTELNKNFDEWNQIMNSF